MHPNPAFRSEPRTRNLAFAAERGFGVLCANGPDGPLAAHVPFLISGGGSILETHLVRSNPLARALPAPAVMMVSGPDGYISPDWYGMDDQVPTWNYVAVHLRGTLEPLPDQDLHDLLDRQSRHFEDRLPKPPWHIDKMPADKLARMMRTLVPVRIRIDDVQGTWKLGQNKPEAARQSAARQLDAFGIGPDTTTLAALMHAITES